ncbi:MAG TPA: hypothetical protein VGF95_11625 [Solirubrobacteraceae bacterium]
MTDRGEAVELRERVRSALSARLEPAGWRRVDRREGGMKLASFILPLNHEFAATVEYRRAFSIPDWPPLRISQPTIGVVYEPLRRLWPLLEEHIRLASLSQSVREMPDAARLCKIALGAQDEIAPAVEQLAGIALEHAVVFAEPLANVDALLDALGYGRPGKMRSVVPALLAAAGRAAEARSSLARYAAESEANENQVNKSPADEGQADTDKLPETRRRTRRFVYQLNRWLDSGCDASLLPPEPPPSRHERGAEGERPSTRKVFGDASRRKAAVDAVKHAAGGRDRASLRNMLEAELALRDLALDPLDVEQQLDRLSKSPLERSREGANALKTLGRIGRAIHRQELPKLPDMSVPDWLEPPVPAVYVFPASKGPGRHWTAVQLDDGCDQWLQRVLQAVPRLIDILDSVSFDAWVASDATPDRQNALAVHIGERRVGLLDDEATAAYARVVEAAAQRAELPCVEARLTPITAEATYLLEIALPAALR